MPPELKPHFYPCPLQPLVVKLREMILTHKDLTRKLSALEKKYEGQFQSVFEAIRQLSDVEEKPKKGLVLSQRNDKRCIGRPGSAECQTARPYEALN